MAEADRPLLVIVPLPPTYRGGTEEYAYRLVERFRRTRAVRVLTTTVDPTPGSPPVPSGPGPIERLPARSLFQRPVLASSEARRRLREAVRGAALVQLHMPFPFVERKVVEWARAAKVPVVLTYHMDADFAGASGVPGAGAVTFAYRWLSAHPALAGADAVVSNSRGYALASPVFRRHLSKLRVIPKGIDLDRFRPGPGGPATGSNAPTGFDDTASSGSTILFVGRLVPYKGLRVLVEALARLLPRLPTARLFVAGRGPERAALESLVARRGLEGRVRFLGFVPDEELGAWYRRVDVVACPSIGALESTATTLEEAAALGTPILGSALPGAEESLPHDGIRGLLCPPGDPEAVARGLERLLVQPRPPPPEGPPRSWDDTAHDYRVLFRELGVEA